VKRERCNDLDTTCQKLVLGIAKLTRPRFANDCLGAIIGHCCSAFLRRNINFLKDGNAIKVERFGTVHKVGLPAEDTIGVVDDDVFKGDEETDTP